MEFTVNTAWIRKLVSDELVETLVFAGFVKTADCKEKKFDAAGKATHYTIKTTFGHCTVYGPKSIYVNKTLCKSLAQARQIVYNFI